MIHPPACKTDVSDRYVVRPKPEPPPAFELLREAGRKSQKRSDPALADKVTTTTIGAQLRRALELLRGV